jgi:DNA replication protein DnaC
MMKTQPQQQFEQSLARLRLPYIAEVYQDVIDEGARTKQSILSILSQLLAGEVALRDERAMDRRIRSARLPKERTLAEYDFAYPKQIAKQKILRYFDCDFIRENQNLLLVGNQGMGKTHLLVALGYEACRKGINTRFTRVIDMINDLTTAQQAGTLGRALRTYIKPDLLLLDELGYLPVDKRGADLMFQVVAARYEQGSIAITTNRPFNRWGDIFDVDKTLASAMIDRLMHHGDALLIKGDSYRVKDRKL